MTVSVSRDCDPFIRFLEIKIDFFFLHGSNKNALLAFSQNHIHGTASEKVSSFQNDDDDNNNSNNNDDDADCDNKINQSHETMI